MVNHSIFSRDIKYDYMNILTSTILQKTQILNGCETFAFKYILLTVPRLYFFCGSFMLLFCLVFAMSLCASVYMCFVVTCWERADLLALVCGVYCEFVTFPFVSWVRCGT